RGRAVLQRIRGAGTGLRLAPPRGGEAGSCGPDGLGRTSRSPGGSHLQGPRGGPPPAAGTGGERVPMPMTLAPSHAFAHASTCAAAYVFSVPRRARPVEEQVRAVDRKSTRLNSSHV